MRIADLNAMDESELVGRLRGVWEHSPWIAEAIVSERPFEDADDLMIAMWTAVEESPDTWKLELLQAHPDLAGKLARAGDLTAESAGEQTSAGLDRLSDEEYARFTELNAAYRTRFGFPFIICVRNHSKDSILRQFGRRLMNSQDIEMENALDEVRQIAEYRLRDLIES